MIYEANRILYSTFSWNKLTETRKKLLRISHKTWAAQWLHFVTLQLSGKLLLLEKIHTGRLTVSNSRNDVYIYCNFNLEVVFLNNIFMKEYFYLLIILISRVKYIGIVFFYFWVIMVCNISIELTFKCYENLHTHYLSYIISIKIICFN